MTGHIAKFDHMEIWYESFGDKSHPAVLLIMGNSCDALFWPESFCLEIAKKGYYVIRYDQRDTGLSTKFEFDKNPYTLLDMAEDAVGLLNFLEISKAHIIGYSTGGSVAQFLSLNHLDRVATLTLMMTSLDLAIKNDAFLGIDTTQAKLPPPKEEFVQAVKQVNSKKPKDLKEKIIQLVENFSLANGGQASFDREFFYQLFEQSIQRSESLTKLKTGHESNHARATSATKPISEKELNRICVPVLILAGGEDPIFPPGHAEALNDAIPHSKLICIERMGHVLNPEFFGEITTAIINHIQQDDFL